MRIDEILKLGIPGQGIRRPHWTTYYLRITDTKRLLVKGTTTYAHSDNAGLSNPDLMADDWLFVEGVSTKDPKVGDIQFHDGEDNVYRRIGDKYYKEISKDYVPNNGMLIP